MRRLLTAALFLVFVQTAAAQVAERASPIVWLEDLQTAHALSVEDGKPVVAYFTFET